MNKTYPSAADALRDILKDGQKIAVGGFGLCGIPEALIQAVKDLGAQNLTAIANNAGVDAQWKDQQMDIRSFLTRQEYS